MSKIKVVAIAKDEGAYLAEWVFHHLYFGFDAIDIYINRTTDNSIDMLKQISLMHNNVNFYGSDWVDTVHGISGYMQNVVYASAFYSKENQKNFTHVLFLDIDEYWLPLDFKTSIHEFILTLPKNNISCSFPWFAMRGEEEELKMLPENIYGDRSTLVKTLIKTSAKIKRFRFHYPIFDIRDDETSLMSDGTIFRRSEKYPQQIDASLNHGRYKFVILHRMNRSEMEYLSMLYRGNPEADTPIKLNRNGWLSLSNLRKEPILLKINTGNRLVYDSEKKIFFEKLSIDDLLDEAYLFVRDRYRFVLSLLPKLLQDDFKSVSRVLVGLSKPEVVHIVKKNKEEYLLDSNLINSIKLISPKVSKINFIEDLADVFYEEKCSNISEKLLKDKSSLAKEIPEVVGHAALLRDMALFYEKEQNDILMAYKLMRVAFKLRPTAPVISKKYDEYSKILNM